MPRRILAAAAAGASLFLATPAVHADDLTLSTVELGSWNDAIAALRADLGSQGRTFHVSVEARGARVACDGYRLELDQAAQEALRVGACDPRTGETALRLADRAALFDQGSHVPRPRTLTVAAVLRATAVAGGGPQGGSAVHCSMAVQPYLDDLQHGTRVLLTPEHYLLRPGSTSITVTPSPSGWSFSTTERAVVELQYEVLERATGEVVLRQKTTLTCGPEAPGVAAPAPTPTPVVERREEGGVSARPDSMAAWIAETKRRLPTPTPKREPMRAWGTDHAGSVAGALVTGILSSLALTGSAAFFAVAAHTHESGFNIGGGVALVPTAVWGAMFAGFVYDAGLPPKPSARPSRRATLRPSLVVANRSGVAGLAGAF